MLGKVFDQSNANFLLMLLCTALEYDCKEALCVLFLRHAEISEKIRRVLKRGERIVSNPIRIACKFSNIETLGDLLSRFDFLINVRGYRDEEYPLSTAIQKRSIPFARLLIESGAKIGVGSNFHDAIESNLPEMMDLLCGESKTLKHLEDEYKFLSLQDNVLIKSYIIGSKDMVDYFIAMGCDINATSSMNETLLGYTVFYKDEKSFLRYLDMGAKIDPCCFENLMDVSEEWEDSVVPEIILNHVREMDQDTTVEFLRDHLKGCEGTYLMDYLFDELRLDVNDRDLMGNTILHWCVMDSQRDTIRFMDYLTKKGINTQTRNNKGDTANDIAHGEKNSVFSKRKKNRKKDFLVCTESEK